MAGSAKPRRRKAAPASLQYGRQPGRRGSNANKFKKKGEFAFGCFVLLAFTGAVALLATVNILWGDETWQWAADEWPGGSYGFAAFVGALAPCLATLFVRSLDSMKWKSWKSHKARTLGHTALSVTCGAALVQYVSLVFNAQDTGKWGRGRSTPPSWAFSSYPWLWAVGLASTIVTIAVLVWASTAHSRVRRLAPEAQDAGSPTQAGSADTA